MRPATTDVTAQAEPELLVDCAGYAVPVDPMEELQCDSCQ